MTNESDPDGHWAAARENVQAQERERGIGADAAAEERRRVRGIIEKLMLAPERWRDGWYKALKRALEEIDPTWRSPLEEPPA
jgi:hypothetical protein